MSLLSDIIHVTDEEIYDNVQSFSNLYDLQISSMLTDYGLVEPITLAQIQGLDSDEQKAITKVLAPIVARAILLLDYITTIPAIDRIPKYANIAEYETDLPNHLAGEELTIAQTNIAKIKLIKQQFGSLVDENTIFNQVSALVNIKNQINDETHGKDVLGRMTR
jgi:hypothetical protein